LNERLNGADAVISCWTNIPDEVLRANPQIRYVGSWTNLVQHRINLDLAREMGITITYIPDYGTIAVAEHAIALLLELMRNVAKQADDTVRGKWPYELLKTSLYVPSIDEIPYHTLCGKKIGIVGLGRIGKRVAQIALGFGMEVSYFSKTRKLEWEARGVHCRELDDLLRESDVVTLHMSPYANLDPFGRISLDDRDPSSAALLAKDTPIISKEKLALMRKGAIFINTSAGRLVDEAALLDEAESGRIRVAVDVYLSNPDRKRIKQIVQKYGKGINLFTYRGGWLTYESVLFKGDSLIKQASEFLGN
jgi:glycerate dehydrogenase